MDVQPIHAEFDYLTVTRAGGIAGAVERVHLHAAMQADVHRFLGLDGHTRLDASTAAETIRQLGALVKRGGTQPAGTRRPGGDIFQYQIELGWKGQVYHFHADGLGVDEALHGAVALADRLLELEPAHLPANGNPGTVPPWLQASPYACGFPAVADGMTRMVRATQSAKV